MGLRVWYEALFSMRSCAPVDMYYRCLCGLWHPDKHKSVYVLHRHQEDCKCRCHTCIKHIKYHGFCDECAYNSCVCPDCLSGDI